MEHVTVSYKLATLGRIVVWELLEGPAPLSEEVVLGITSPVRPAPYPQPYNGTLARLAQWLSTCHERKVECQDRESWLRPAGW